MQEERQRVKEKGEGEVESTTSANSEMPVERILEAELAVEPKTDTYLDAQKDAVTNICQAADKQLFTLVDWAKRIPHFTELPLEDQVILLRAGQSHLPLPSRDLQNHAYCRLGLVNLLHRLVKSGSRHSGISCTPPFFYILTI